MKYSVMSRGMKSYFMSEDHSYSVEKYYDSIKKFVLSEGSVMYGAVLVSMKRVKVGFFWNIKVNTMWWKHYKKPSYNKYTKAFTWLIFHISWGGEYEPVPDKVVKDFLSEQEEWNK
jgi:hypothetical protein